MSGSATKKSDNMRYYDILGVSKLAWDDELKRAYTETVIKNNPDKRGDPEKLKEVAQAYEVSRDPEKHRIYNEYGEDRLKKRMGGYSGGKEAETAIIGKADGGRSRR